MDRSNPKNISKPQRGFTLIELMITISVLAILAAVAAPKFVEMLRKSSEASTKGSLDRLRLAISVYWSSQESNFPDSLAKLVPDYIDALPNSKLGAYHKDSSLERVVFVDTISASEITDENGWVYSSKSGVIVVNCTQSDSQGNPITAW